MGVQNTLAKEKEQGWSRFLLITGIVLVSINLRPAITSVGPLLGSIRDDIGLSNWSVGLMTSLPLIAFAVMSPIVPRIGRRFTNEYALVIGLILLLAGIVLRSISAIALLFAGTLLVGLGIAFCNVLLPGVIKEKFPMKVALMTSVYSTAMATMAAVASGISIPLANGWDLGWSNALLVWIIPVIIAIVLWLYLSKKDRTDIEDTIYMKHTSKVEKNIWRSPLAWQVAFYLGMQASLFYITISWLPEILIDYGLNIAMAGWMLSVTQLIGLPASFLIPVIAVKFKSQQGIVLVLGSFAVSGYCGLLFGSSYTVMIISIILIGIPLGGSFALALAFLGLRARTAEQSADLSGMVQSFGYLLAAGGPMFIGYLFDITHVWTVPLITLIVLSILIAIFGLAAGKDKYVFD